MPLRAGRGGSAPAAALFRFIIPHRAAHGNTSRMCEALFPSRMCEALFPRSRAAGTVHPPGAYFEVECFLKGGGNMLSVLLNRLGNLLCVKSIVTIVLTVVFACLALSGKITGQDFLTVFSVVIAFYFGTQSQRLNEKLTETTGEKKQTDK